MVDASDSAAAAAVALLRSQPSTPHPVCWLTPHAAAGVELAFTGARKKVNYTALVTAGADVGLGSIWMGTVCGCVFAGIQHLLGGGEPNRA